MNNDLNSFEDYIHGVVFPRYAMEEGLSDDLWCDAENDFVADMLPEDVAKYANEYANAKVKAVHTEYLVILRKVEGNLKGAL
jgi:hypothetical protein